MDESQNLKQQRQETQSAPLPRSAEGADRLATNLAPQKLRSLTVAGTVAVGVVAAALTYVLAPNWFPGSGQDPTMTMQARQEQAAAFAAHGTLSFPLVSETEQAQAVGNLDLSTNEKDALQTDLDRTGGRLARVTLWDNFDNDGDIVRLRSDGFTLEVTLTNSPQTYVVPVTSAGIQMDGISDGGGGITVSFQTESGPVVSPLLFDGQSIHIPVALP